MSYHWTFDAGKQVLSSPFGYTITVKEIATQLQDKVANSHDFGGAWSGWKMRQGVLIGPRGQRFVPSNIRALGD